MLDMLSLTDPRDSQMSTNLSDIWLWGLIKKCGQEIWICGSSAERYGWQHANDLNDPPHCQHRERKVIRTEICVTVNFYWRWTLCLVLENFVLGGVSFLTNHAILSAKGCCVWKKQNTEQGNINMHKLRQHNQLQPS